MRQQWIFPFLFLIIFNTVTATSDFNFEDNEMSFNSTNSSTKQYSISVIGWQFHHLRLYLIITIFIIMVIFLKFTYHWIPYISAYIPESCILIALGCLFGLVLQGQTNDDHVKLWKLSPNLFFLILLPPIIIESSFHLYNPVFAANLIPVLLFAVVGTLFNFLLIGVGLWGLDHLGAMGIPLGIDLKHAFLFSSLIVAVDPVAVLAIFHDIGVDENLYFIVFGESLLNDAVTIVLYKMMQSLLMIPVVGAKEIALGITSFFTISLGGCFIGILVGILSCIITRFTSVDRKMEPLVLLSLGYLAYLLGDLFEWSGIMSSIMCGVIQAGYAFHNISDKSRLTIQRSTIMFANVMEAIIFLFLGIQLMIHDFDWHTGFCLWTFVLCLIVRTGITILLSFLCNYIHLSTHKITFTEQFMISYGGLRGAVAFSLASLIDERILATVGLTKERILTTTMFIILFTVCVQGLTIKPLVKLLHIKLKTKERLSLMYSINSCVIEHLMFALEVINGHKGRYSVHEVLDNFNSKYVRPLLERDPEARDTKVVHVLRRIETEILLASNSVYDNKECEKHLNRLPTMIRHQVLQRQKKDTDEIEATDLPVHVTIPVPLEGTESQNKLLDISKRERVITNPEQHTTAATPFFTTVKMVMAKRHSSNPEEYSNVELTSNQSIRNLFNKSRPGVLSKIDLQKNNETDVSSILENKPFPIRQYGIGNKNSRQRSKTTSPYEDRSVSFMLSETSEL